MNVQERLRYRLLRVAAAIPKMKVADIEYNVNEIITLAREAHEKGVHVVVFPEMSLTGYTIKDLNFQELLQEKTIEHLQRLLRASKMLAPVIIVGMPLSVSGQLYNVAAILQGGTVYGLVPKTALPNYREFEEKRWFGSARILEAKGIKEVELFGKKVPIGRDILFPIEGMRDAMLGVEICEDLWIPIQPSIVQYLYGATVVANLSASNDTTNKMDYRRNLVSQQSGRGIGAYVYVSCGPHESTTDLVFGGDAIIAENGTILEESEFFSRENQLVISDIDIGRLIADRQRMDTYHETVFDIPKKDFRVVPLQFIGRSDTTLYRSVNPFPFVPSNPEERNERCEKIFSKQVAGLAKRLEHTGIHKVVIGVSGGLDSTHALLVAAETFKKLGYPARDIYALTMPGFGTTDRTKDNAKKLCDALGVTLTEIDITKTAASILGDIGYDMSDTKSVTFQNVQARLRKLLEFGKANQIMAIDMGTGDLSEIALGWCTFSGDHIASYNVMCDVPKTLVFYVVEWYRDTHAEGLLKERVSDILVTPPSAELEGSKDGAKTQTSEEILGPYNAHDFTLNDFVRWGYSPSKIMFFAKRAFRNMYAQKDLHRWLGIFLRRFFGNQWKRSVMTDGPKIGSVSLSPRGDWRMPSDAEVTLWLHDLDEAAKTIEKEEEKNE